MKNILRNPNNQFSPGFTLIEVLLALGIMATALVLLASGWSSNFSRMDKTQLSFEVSTLLERKLIEFDHLYRGKSLNDIKDEDEGDFGENYPKFKWKMKSAFFPAPDFSLILGGLQKNTPPEVLNAFKGFSTTLEKAIKEVQITVIYMAPKKELEFTATTYFINYDEELNIGL